MQKYDEVVVIVVLCEEVESMIEGEGTFRVGPSPHDVQFQLAQLLCNAKYIKDRGTHGWC